MNFNLLSKVQKVCSHCWVSCLAVAVLALKKERKASEFSRRQELPPELRHVIDHFRQCQVVLVGWLESAPKAVEKITGFFLGKFF